VHAWGFSHNETTGEGLIVIVDSISAQRVRPGSAPYSSTKFGLVELTHCTILDGLKYGINCGCLHPENTFIERRIGSTKDADDEPMMSVKELAAAAVYMACQQPNVNILELIQLPG